MLNINTLYHITIIYNEKQGNKLPDLKNYQVIELEILFNCIVLQSFQFVD